MATLIILPTGVKNKQRRIACIMPTNNKCNKRNKFLLHVRQTMSLCGAPLYSNAHTLCLILLDFTLIFLFSRLKEWILSYNFYGFAFSFYGLQFFHSASSGFEDLPHLLRRPLSHTHFLCERQE